MTWSATMTMDDRASAQDALRREAKDWVVLLAAGAATQADLAALQHWRARSPEHAEAYARACRLWGALGTPLAEAAAADASAAKVRSPKLASTKIASPSFARPVGRRALLAGGAAASVAVATGILAVRPPLQLWPSLAELSADYRTGVGEQRSVALADRGLVELNTRTSLNIGANDAADIELVAGEAAVTAGPRPVVVRAAEGRMSASDAQFTVRCDGADVRVTCLGGRVEVDLGGNRAVVQTRQQIGYAVRGLGPVVTVDPEIAAGWRDGLLVFRDEPLSRVIDEVNRYRSGRIILTNAALGERRVSARFKLARLDAVLTQFQEVFGVKARTLVGGIVLLS